LHRQPKGQREEAVQGYLKKYYPLKNLQVIQKTKTAEQDLKLLKKTEGVEIFLNTRRA
jgi:hypothetical protein